MAKSKGSRFLFTILISIGAIVVGGLIDSLFQTSGSLLLSAAYALMIWATYLIHADLLADPDAIVARFLKNVTLVLLIALYVITVLFGAMATFTSTQAPELMISATLIAPAVVFPAALYTAKNGGILLEWAPVVPAATMVASGVVSLIFHILGTLSWIGGLIVLVASLVASFIMLKEKYVHLIKVKQPKFTPRTYYGNDDDKKTAKDSPIRNSLTAIRSVGGVGIRLTLNGTTYTPSITTSLDGDGTLNVTIGGDVYFAEGEKANVQSALDEEILKVKTKVVNKYHYEVDSLAKRGVDVSCMKKLSISGGSIRSH